MLSRLCFLVACCLFGDLGVKKFHQSICYQYILSTAWRHSYVSKLTAQKLHSDLCHVHFRELHSNKHFLILDHLVLEQYHIRFCLMLWYCCCSCWVLLFSSATCIQMLKKHSVCSVTSFPNVPKQAFVEVLQNNPKPVTLLKRDSNTGVFQWILRNFKNTFFHRTPPVVEYDVVCSGFLGCLHSLLAIKTSHFLW